MNTKATFLLAVLFMLVACNEQVSLFTLEGEYGSGNDTIYVYGIDSRYEQIDTIQTNDKGYFEYILETDTVIPLTMVLPNGSMLPLYAEPNVDAAMKYENDRWLISGGAIQALHDSISDRIESVLLRSQRLEKIDSFIKCHPYSDVNIHLLQRYLVDVYDAKGSLIKKRIEYMGGTLQDNSYISSVKRLADGKIQNINNRSMPEYTFVTAGNDTIKRSTFMDKYLLVTVWASWDTASISYLKKFNDVKDKLDKDYFERLNISIDHDTAAWKRCIENDSITGYNVCDVKMWDNAVVKEFTIEKLPFSMLVNPYMRINSFNIKPYDFVYTVDSLINKFKVKEKAKKEKEAARKKEQEKKDKGNDSKTAAAKKKGLRMSEANKEVNEKIIK